MSQIQWVSDNNANGLNLLNLGISEDPSSAVRLDYLRAQIAAVRAELEAAEASLMEKIAALPAQPGSGGNQKADCLIAIAENFNIAAGGLPFVQGRQLLEGDRVLLVNQLKREENGIYVARPSTWVRSYDANDPADFSYGMSVVVTAGDAGNIGTWALTSPDPIALDKTPLTFVLKDASGEIPVVIPVELGGTGATSAAAARRNLGCVEQRNFFPLGDGTSKKFRLQHDLNNDTLLEPAVLHLQTRQYLKASASCPNAGEVEVEFAHPPAQGSIAIILVGVALD